MASPFGQKASDQEMKDFEMPKPGLHPATLIGLVDLGTQTSDYQGKTEEQHKIFVAWELATEFDSSGKPFVVGEGYTFSLNKKANWRAMLEGWSGRKFGENEEFDPLVLLGKNCNCNITHGITGNKKKYCSVDSVSQLMQGQTVPKTVNPTFWWHFAVADLSVTPAIPEWMPRFLGDLLVDVIKESKEWKASSIRPASAQQTNGAAHTPAQAQPVTASNDPPF